MSELSQIYDAIKENKDWPIFGEIGDDVLSQELDIFEGRPMFNLIFDIENDEGNEKRFAKPMTEKDVLTLKAANESKNTRDNTDWIERIFSDWRRQRNSLSECVLVPELTDVSVDELNRYLSFFIAEIRRKDGQPYPPRTLYNIASGVLRVLREKEITDRNFLDVKDGRFLMFRNTFDACMKELTRQGLLFFQLAYQSK